MTETFNVIEEDRNVTEAEREWDSAIAIAPGSNMRKLVRALLSEADRIDNDLDELYDAQHIDSAENETLEKYGNLVGVNRKTGESDNKYRARVKAEFRQGTIETTFDQFSEFAATILNTDIENLEFIVNLSGDPATVDVGVDNDILNNTDLTDQEIADLLGGGVPAGHEVKIFQGGTFRLKADGEADDPDKGLTSDSISTGGTLAEDLV